MVVIPVRRLDGSRFNPRADRYYIYIHMCVGVRANFRDKPLFQATKQHLNTSYTVKNEM